MRVSSYATNKHETGMMEKPIMEAPLSRLLQKSNNKPTVTQGALSRSDKEPRALSSRPLAQSYANEVSFCKDKKRGTTNEFRVTSACVATQVGKSEAMPEAIQMPLSASEMTSSNTGGAIYDKYM